MADSLILRRDVDFLLHDWLLSGKPDSRPIASGISRATIDAVLDLSEKLAEDSFLSHYKQSDREEPFIADDRVHICPATREALRQYAELGLFAAGFPEELGGLSLPYLISATSFVYFAAANISTAAYTMLTTANARLLTTFGSNAQIETFALPQIEGRWFGTMCLSEANAGSSLSEIRTRAVPDGEDRLGQRYRIYGNKMWISGGDQDASENIVHLVLAKVPDANGALCDGTRGISLFVVPKLLEDRPNDVVVAGLNHKMGYRGTTNCILNFGEKEGAIGWLVGDPGRGLAQMFHMMNEARISVGLGAAALGYRSHILSVNYARERLQGRAPGVSDGSQIAIIEHADVKRMLLAQKCYAEGSLAMCLFCARLVDQGDEDSLALLDLLTPIAKTWPSEYGLLANDIAIQIHGGCGYTRDFDVEQLWRDNRLNPIHEGTTGVQAIDLVGRKIRRNERGMAVLDRQIADTIVRSEKIVALAPHGETLRQAWDHIVGQAGILREMPAERAIENATPFLWAFGHVVAAWLWLEQAIVADAIATNSVDALLEGKGHACQFFFRNELPKINLWLDIVRSAAPGVATVPSYIF